jgi:hypothetical protein
LEFGTIRTPRVFFASVCCVCYFQTSSHLGWWWYPRDIIILETPEFGDKNLLVLLFVDSWPSTKRFVIWVLSLSYYLQFLFCFLEVWAPFLFTIFVFEISSMVQVRRSIGLVSESVIYQFLVFWETDAKIPESGACCCTKVLNPIFQCMIHTMVWASHRGRDLKIQWFFFVGGLG